MSSFDKAFLNLVFEFKIFFDSRKFHFDSRNFYFDPRKFYFDPRNLADSFIEYLFHVITYLFIHWKPRDIEITRNRKCNKIIPC